MTYWAFLPECFSQIPLNKKLAVAAKTRDNSRIPSLRVRVLSSVISTIYAKHEPVIVPNDPVSPSTNEPKKRT